MKNKFKEYNGFNLSDVNKEVLEKWDAEQVFADVRLHPDAEGMSVVGYYIIKEGAQQVASRHRQHNQEEGAVELVREQIVQRLPGNQRRNSFQRERWQPRSIRNRRCGKCRKRHVLRLEILCGGNPLNLSHNPDDVLS